MCIKLEIIVSEFASDELWIDCVCDTGKQLQKPRGAAQSHKVLPIIDLVNVKSQDIFLWCIRKSLFCKETDLCASVEKLEYSFSKATTILLI